jgi:hypothetical protein
MAIEFENLKEKELVYFIKDKDTGAGIGLTTAECYEVFQTLKKMFPEIKGPENIRLNSI